MLDVGCGTGFALSLSAERGAVVLGVDQSSEMLAIAQKKAAEAGVHASFSLGDAQRLDGVADASFDVVTAAALVPYLADPPAALQRWKRVLRSGGRCVFHGFHDASVLGVLATRAAAEVGISLNFERWTGSAEACAQLARDAGFSGVKVATLPILDKHTADEAKAALKRMLVNPLCAPLASACRDDAQLFDRLQAAYDELVDASVAADGFLHTRGECFIITGFA